jgi:hypothetical protein
MEEEENGVGKRKRKEEEGTTGVFKRKTVVGGRGWPEGS